jgi:hypothetical protein
LPRSASAEAGSVATTASVDAALSRKRIITNFVLTAFSEMRLEGLGEVGTVPVVAARM